MSTEEPSAASASASLPELTTERIDQIERMLFADISRERSAKRARRGRWWIGGAAAAAVVVVAAIIAPTLGGLVTTSGGMSESAVMPDMPLVAPNSDRGVDSFAGEPGLMDLDGAGAAVEESAPSGREIITNASATVVVADIPGAAETIGEAAEARDGYVESMSIGRSGVVYPVDPYSGMAYDSMPYPYAPEGAWITVRVPADELSGMVRELSALGEVTASTINRQDVTEQAVDLRARIDAAQASVDRLTELMTQAGSLSDLIAAESALAERQAMLESYQQQLESLESMVAMSSLTVTLTPVVERVEADPAGFLDGLLAGWNGLVATLNGIVVALGFLIPWLIVIAILGAVVWTIVRAVRRRRAANAVNEMMPQREAGVVADRTTEES